MRHRTWWQETERNGTALANEDNDFPSTLQDVQVKSSMLAAVEYSHRNVLASKYTEPKAHYKLDPQTRSITLQNDVGC